MNSRRNSTWSLLFALAILLVCVVLLILRLSTQTQPPQARSTADDSHAVPTPSTSIPQAPPHAVALDAEESPASEIDAHAPDSIPEKPSNVPKAAAALREQGTGQSSAHQRQGNELQEMIRGILVDIEDNPVAGYVTLEFVDQEPNAVPAAVFAIPEPTHQPPGGAIGHAYDVSGELARRFIWRKGDTDEEMTIVLEPYASIVGQLVDSARKPVSDARLHLQMPMRDGRWRGDTGALDPPVIDDEGYFHFDRIPVGSRVRIAARRGAFTGQSRPIVLTPGDVANAGQIVMTGPRPGTGLVQGRITDEHGLPLADRPIMIRLARRGQWLRTDAAGYYLLTDLPAGRPLTVELEVTPYGLWSRTTTPDDFACDFQLSPQGWGLIGKQAPPLFPARWFNHAPMTLTQLKGRVVLLAFRRFQGDADPGLARLRHLHSQYAPQGLTTIAVYDHLPVTDPRAADIVAGHLAALFAGTAIAGFLDTDPDVVADLMPPERPAVAAAGATNWLYQVHARPAFYLIDRMGIVRHITNADADLAAPIQRLLDEKEMSPTP